MTGNEWLLLLAVVSAPITLALIVAMLRGYSITLHMTREPGHSWWRRGKREPPGED